MQINVIVDDDKKGPANGRHMVDIEPKPQLFHYYFFRVVWNNDWNNNIDKYVM